MRRITALIIATGLLLAAGTSLAKDKRKNVREFNFDEDVLTVEFLKPDLEFVGLVKQEQMASLIEIRKDFVDEIVKSAEDL